MQLPPTSPRSDRTALSAHHHPGSLPAYFDTYPRYYSSVSRRSHSPLARQSSLAQQDSSRNHTPALVAAAAAAPAAEVMTANAHWPVAGMVLLLSLHDTGAGDSLSCHLSGMKQLCSSTRKIDSTTRRTCNQSSNRTTPCSRPASQSRCAGRRPHCMCAQSLRP